MLRLLRGIAASLILALCVVGVNLAKADPMPFVLENGVKVIFMPMPIKTTVVLTRFNVGNLDESVAKGEVGLAHFLEHLIAIRGTANHPDRDAIVAEMKKMMVDYNATTTFWATNYFLIGPSQKLEGMIELQSDQVSNPIFLSKDPKVRALVAAAMKQEQEAVVEEAERGLVNPHMSLFEHSIMVHAKTERLQHLMTGTAAQIRAYTPAMVEEFYSKYYTGPNAIVVIAGGIPDMDAALQMVAKTYGTKLRKDAPPATALAKDELRPIKQAQVELVKVRAPGKNTRLLNINYPLRRTVELEGAAELLTKYLNRRGVGSVLQPLVELGLISPVPGQSGLGVFSVRDLMFVRAAFDLTPAGEQKLDVVTEYLRKVFSEIAAKGLSDAVLDDMKRSYANDVDNAGLLDTTVEISESANDNGLEKMMAKFEAVGGVTQDHIKEVASKLLEPRAELTLYSSNLKGKQNEVVERLDFTTQLAVARQELDKAQVTLDAEANPLFRVDEPYMTGDMGKGDTTKIIVVPESENTHAEAIIEFHFMDSMRPNERLGVDLSMLEFRLSPEQARLFTFFNEAGVDFDYSFDANTMKMKVTTSGNAKLVAIAAKSFLTAFRSFDPTPAGITKAKAVMIESLRDAPIGEVSSQALNLGVSVILGGKGRDLTKQIKSVAAVEFLDARKAMAVVHSRWGKQMTLGGNWDNAALADLNQLMDAPNGETLRPKTYSAELPAPPAGGASVTLVVQKADVERNGVARLFAVPVQPYSKEYFAFALFSEVFDNNLMDVVRAERELAYAVGSGVSPLPGGGAVFFMLSDTSKAPGKLALAYTVALYDALGADPSELDFNQAKVKLLQQLARSANGLAGLHAREMENVNWAAIVKMVQSLKREELLGIVKPLLAKARRIDALATNDAASYCSALLKEANALDPTVKNFRQEVLPTVRLKPVVY